MDYKLCGQMTRIGLALWLFMFLLVSCAAKVHVKLHIKCASSAVGMRIRDQNYLGGGKSYLVVTGEGGIEGAKYYVTTYRPCSDQEIIIATEYPPGEGGRFAGGIGSIERVQFGLNQTVDMLKQYKTEMTKIKVHNGETEYEFEIEAGRGQIAEGSMETVGTSPIQRPMPYKCEIAINECKENPCKNGAPCKDEDGFYTCLCTAGFTGKDCETEIPTTTTVVTDPPVEPPVITPEAQKDIVKEPAKEEEEGASATIIAAVLITLAVVAGAVAAVVGALIYRKTRRQRRQTQMAGGGAAAGRVTEFDAGGRREDVLDEYAPPDEPVLFIPVTEGQLAQMNALLTPEVHEAAKKKISQLSLVPKSPDKRLTPTASGKGLASSASGAHEGSRQALGGASSGANLAPPTESVSQQSLGSR